MAPSSTASTGVHQHAVVAVVLVVVLGVFDVVIVFVVVDMFVVFVVIVDVFVVIVIVAVVDAFFTCLLSLLLTHSEWRFSCCRGTGVRVHHRRAAQTERGLVREKPLP